MMPSSCVHPYGAIRRWGAVALLLVVAVFAVGCSTPTTESPGAIGPVDEMPSGDSEAYPGASLPTAQPAYPGEEGAEEAGEEGGESAAGEPAGRVAELAAQVQAATVSIVEDWATFPDTDALEGAISRNIGLGPNTMDVSLDEMGAEPDLPSGPVMVMAYDIVSEPPDDFVGFNRNLGMPADWSDASAVAVWVLPEGESPVDLAFQFKEASGEVWRYSGPLETSGGAMIIPIDAADFEWADWSTEENGQIDLDAVDQYGLYVGHQGPGVSGAVRFGPIVLIPNRE